MKQNISGWGRYPVINSELYSPVHNQDLQKFLESTSSYIGRGNGRSYGDSALNSQCILSSRRLDLIESFDPETGLLIAQSGLLLSEIIDIFLPRGWFLSVSPGTKLITLGGAVGSDVHGKDHHLHGSFARSLAFIDVITADKGLMRLSPDENAELFHASTGGMGLTGFIVRVGLYLQKVPSAYIKQDLYVCGSLKEIMDCFEEHQDLPYSVSWIDCLQKGSHLGRSIFMGGDFAQISELKGKQAKNPFQVAQKGLNVPVEFPGFALNTLSVKAFNSVYFNHVRLVPEHSVVSYNKFFYPLDAIDNWNRIYGRRGFTQYQFVIPKDHAYNGLTKIIGRIAQSGQGSFLTVLKLFGGQPEFKGNLSFPSKGYTLALDFAITPTLFDLLNELDKLVLDYGGHVYLAKDCRLSAETFARMYGQRKEEFLEIKHQVDSRCICRSLQSERLGLTWE